MELSNEFGHEVCPVRINLFLEIDAMLRGNRQKSSVNIIIKDLRQRYIRNRRLIDRRYRRGDAVQRNMAQTDGLSRCLGAIPRIDTQEQRLAGLQLHDRLVLHGIHGIGHHRGGTHT